MNSNYPPGVTGNEPHLKGPDFTDSNYYVICEAEVSAVPVALAKTILKYYNHGETNHDFVANFERLIETSRDSGGICCWDGEVEIDFYGGEGVWVCPACATEHEEILEYWFEGI